MINREQQVYAPMFRLLQGLQGDGGFVKVERRWRLWTDLGSDTMPWLCMCGRTQERGLQANRGTPALWTILLDLWIYARVPEPKSRDEVLNPLLDKVCNLFDWSAPDGVQTLGGMVTWVKIDGEIIKAGGVQGEETALALIPISVILPGAPTSGATAP